MAYSYPMNVTLIVSQATLEEVFSFYQDQKDEAAPDYSLGRYKGDGFVLTIYKADEGAKLLFQGKNAENEAAIWNQKAKKIKLEEKTSSKTSKAPKALYPMIGSDEVGTGSFFGGVVVAAAYVTKDDLPFLKELGITDSKAMEDDRILEIVPMLIGRIPYSLLYLPPEDYNRVNKERNMNAIKAAMHNRALLNLKAKYPEAHVYIDQFCAPKTYYSYLGSEKEILTDISFSTKGESKYPAVAAASVLARYEFLRKLEELGNSYGTELPQGANKNIEDFAVSFFGAYPDAPDKTAKLNFSNYARILERL